MGRMLAPYGVKGWIKARPFTALAATLVDYDRWWLAARDGSEAWQEFAVRSARCHAGTVVAELEGLADREAAARWRGALIGVARTALPELPEGEIYWADMIGFAVVNRAGDLLGTVAGLLSTAAHAVLRVANEDGSERLIPLVPAYLDAIERDARRIVVDWQRDY
jgi:16S rRNA processing protein RimM